MNIKVIVQYDGTDYAGWQRQKGPLTVQEVIENAIQTLTGQETAIHAAGRTDAGVHALHQVLNFHTESRIPIDRWPVALNSRLPDDIVAISAEAVVDEWHARFTPHLKTYRYVIENSPFPSPLTSRYAWHCPEPLDVELMNRAAGDLVGMHDFSAFRAAGSSVKTSTRHVTMARCQRLDTQVHFSVQANGFLYNMVRIMMGTLVDIGSGRRPADEVKRLLTTQDRREAPATAPPQGLCLVAIDYCQDPALDSAGVLD